VGTAVGIDLKKAGLTQRDALLAVADEYDIWRTPDGETFATIFKDGHAEHHAVRSRRFRDAWLHDFTQKYSNNGRPAAVGEGPVRDALQMLEARAYATGIKQEAPLRVASNESGIYIDLGTENWSAINVRAGGWRVIRMPPVPITRSRRTGPMPLPTRGDFNPLRALLDRLSPVDFILFTSWCLGTFLPTGPYPILILGGEQGSGKSTLARLAQRITDAVSGDLLQPPGDDRDLIAAAKHGRVLAFDNVSSIKPDLADSICRLATGAEIGGRALFTDHETATFRACRPIILNGIPDLAARGDLADRSIVIRLSALPERVTERDFWRQVDEVLPMALGGFLDALAVGTEQFGTTATPNVRMADFARFITAAEPALPWITGQFLEAYAGNRRQMVTSIVEGDLVAAKVDFFMVAKTEWSGLISELYHLLSDQISSDARRIGDWPGNARWFSDRLTRAAPALRALGVDIRTRPDARGTKVIIQKK
jgi:hypothetical protein